MFEEKTYEMLLKNALARISSTVDKREGSMVMNGVAPSMAELAQLYIGLDFVFTATYLKTAPREYLIKRAADRNMAPYPASAAIHRAELNIEVPAGTRFSCEDLNFIVTARMDTEDDTETGFSHKVTCETAGSAANGYSGTLIPIEYVSGLARAELMENLIPGQDEEETEVFRQRVINSLQSKAFGGNQADYIEKALAEGAGQVKVTPCWNENIAPSSLIPNETVTTWYESAIESLTGDVKTWLKTIYAATSNQLLTVGGTVKLTILAKDTTSPYGYKVSTELAEALQTTFDPTQNSGEGVGLAPIGHVVNVISALEQEIDITSTFTYATGKSFTDAEISIRAAINNYFKTLIANWKDSQSLTIRISQIESRILSECTGLVEDITGTTLNGASSNITLTSDYIPKLGGVIDG